MAASIPKFGLIVASAPRAVACTALEPPWAATAESPTLVFTHAARNSLVPNFEYGELQAAHPAQQQSVIQDTYDQDKRHLKVS